MRKVLRTLVLWLIAVALPLQGLAMSAMMAQGPFHASASCDAPSQPAAGPASYAIATAHSAAMAQHGHGHAELAVAVGTAAQPGPSDSDNHCTGTVGHGVHKSCSAACSAVPLDVPENLALTRVSSPAPRGPVATDYLGVVLDGPERPPKRFFA